MDELIKNLRINLNDEFVKFRDETKLRIDENDTKMHREFSKLLDDTTQAIEDSINHNLIVQMKEMD